MMQLISRFAQGLKSSPTENYAVTHFFGHLIDAVEGYDKFGGWAIPFPQ